MSEPHDVVKLLLARMKSHPEEFRVENGRWAQWLDQLIPFVTEAERVLLREPMMQDIHEKVLDELCNGDERRRKVFEEHEYERNLAKSLLLTKQQMMQQAQQSLQNAYSNAYDVDRDMYRNTPTGPIPIANGGTGALTNTINQIKEMLGAKK